MFDEPTPPPVEARDEAVLQQREEVDPGGKGPPVEAGFPQRPGHGGGEQQRVDGEGEAAPAGEQQTLDDQHEAGDQIEPRAAEGDEPAATPREREAEQKQETARDGAVGQG